jgi:integrase/recombinase XerD
MSHDPKSPQAPTDFDRELERYIRYLTLERGRSANTISAYRGDLVAYRDWLAARRVTRPVDITPVHASEYVATLQGARTTTARKLSSIRNFHRYLQDENVVVGDVTLELISPKIPGRLPKALSIEQVQRLLDAVVGDTPVALRDRALLELLYATGARVSELMNLSLDDLVDDRGGTAEAIRVTGKGSKQRIVPVGSFARNALDSYITRARPALVSGARKATARVFVGARGAALSRQNAWLIIQSAARLADLQGLVSPHTLRHSFATHLISGGADIRVVQELLGHSSVSTTQIYTKVTIDTLRDVYVGAHPRAR